MNAGCLLGVFLMVALLGCSRQPSVVPVPSCLCGYDSVFLQACMSQGPPVVVQRGYTTALQAPSVHLGINSIVWSERYFSVEGANFSVAQVRDTGSMRPALNDGNSVVLIPASRSNVHVGDIVSYRAGWYGSVVTHRVVNITASGYVLKGDNNLEADPELVSFNQILGVVVAVLY